MLPGSEILLYPYPLKTVSETEKRDPEMQSKVDSFEKTCQKKCYSNRCHFAISITSSVPSRKSSASLGFSVNTAKQPDLYSKSLPIMTFIQYFSFVMGCFGLWFGISFLSFDPRKLCHRKHAKRYHSVAGNRALNAALPT